MGPRGPCFACHFLSTPIVAAGATTPSNAGQKVPLGPKDAVISAALVSAASFWKGKRDRIVLGPGAISDRHAVAIVSSTSRRPIAYASSTGREKGL